MLKHTAKGTPYLTAPEVRIICKPSVDLEPVREFIRQLFPESDYLEDEPLTDAARLVKFAGQLCYLSLGKERSRNSRASEYLRHIKEQAHGSVKEHPGYTLLLWGVSRALTHELVRHRAGFAFSQVSQRYVAGKHLRFVESLASQFNPQAEKYPLTDETVTQAELHIEFCQWVDAAREQYERREALLLRKAGIDYKTATTDQRKAVRQEARRCLPNETEAPIVVTGNLRAWRHAIEQRCSPYADAEICRCFYAIFEALRSHEPILWEDYTVENKRADGLPTVQTPYRKV